LRHIASHDFNEKKSDIKVGLTETFVLAYLKVSSFYETRKRTILFADFLCQNNQTPRKIEDKGTINRYESGRRKAVTL
jgi:hypothetical protein